MHRQRVLKAKAIKKMQRVRPLHAERVACKIYITADVRDGIAAELVTWQARQECDEQQHRHTEDVQLESRTQEVLPRPGPTFRKTATLTHLLLCAAVFFTVAFYRTLPSLQQKLLGAVLTPVGSVPPPWLPCLSTACLPGREPAVDRLAVPTVVVRLFADRGDLFVDAIPDAAFPSNGARVRHTAPALVDTARACCTFVMPSRLDRC